MKMYGHAEMAVLPGKDAKSPLCIMLRAQHDIKESFNMTFFDVLKMFGGMSLFLFGMNVMGDALERRAGNSLRTLLGKLTTNRLLGLLTGLAVTGIIQSSAATTVMVVGFVNSSLMSLGQAINVIMGANIGTTVTAWLLSLTGISSGNFFMQMLKPTNFTPLLGLVGVGYMMFCKDEKRKQTGTILLGFATLMFGMDTMTNALKGLADVPAFQQLFTMFTNPILGVLAGALLTAAIQSSSASVGVLQALSMTGQVTFGSAIPIIMGQNIGTCITALISSVGTSKNAKRAALVHLCFNVIGTAICLILYYVVKWVFDPVLLSAQTNPFSIAITHSCFNVFCTVVLFPMAGLLEKLVCHLVPDAKRPEVATELDDRLLTTPAVALERCRVLSVDMANVAVDAMKDAISCLTRYDEETAAQVREAEDRTDHYEDLLGTYLVKLSSRRIGEQESAEAAKLLKVIGDFERISDHAVNVLESAEEMNEKNLQFSDAASHEMAVLLGVLSETLDLARQSFIENDLQSAFKVEPMEQVIDNLKETLRTRHIKRLQQGECSIDVGFVWTDLLTNLERTSDHCSNIAGCVIDVAHHNMNMHEMLRETRTDSAEYKALYEEYKKKYAV